MGQRSIKKRGNGSVLSSLPFLAESHKTTKMTCDSWCAFLLWLTDRPPRLLTGGRLADLTGSFFIFDFKKKLQKLKSYKIWGRPISIYKNVHPLFPFHKHFVFRRLFVPFMLCVFSCTIGHSWYERLTHDLYYSCTILICVIIGIARF